MKSSFLFIAALFLAISVTTPGQDGSESGVEVIEDYQNLYQYKNFYLSGQPSLEALKWLKAEGVTRIINIRSEGENETFTEEAFNEKAMALSLGFDYHNIPVNGSADYTPEKLQELSPFLDENEKIMIHCGSAGRVTNFFMAYLVQTRGYTIDEAIDVGKGLRFTFALEQILDADISMEFGDEK